MASTRKTFPTWWHHITRLVLVSAVLFISACTTSGHPISTPSASSPERGQVGAAAAGNGGNGGY
jgi:hypothetical protein